MGQGFHNSVKTRVVNSSTSPVTSSSALSAIAACTCHWSNVHLLHIILLLSPTGPLFEKTLQTAFEKYQAITKAASSFSVCTLTLN